MKFIVLLTFIFPGLYAGRSVSHQKLLDIPEYYDAKAAKLFKYVVSIVDLQKFNVNDPKQFGKGHLCTGVIIDSRHVLTAENCIYGTSYHLAVIAGTPVLTRKQLATQIANVRSLRGMGQMGYVIMTLRDKLKLDSQFVQSIKIYPKQKSLKPDQNCSLVGWGWRKPGKECEFSTTLLDISFMVEYEEFCISILFPIPKTFCAGSYSKEIAENRCPDVSGRPLICDDQLVGIEMFTRNCHGLKHATFFYDAHFLDFSHDPSIGKDDTSKS